MMAGVGISSCLIAVLLFCSYVVNVESKGGEMDTCSVETSVRFDDGAQTNSTCGYVQGRLQVCEDQVWKNLCDTNWTFSDAQVTCRSLNYSAIGAENIAIPQGTTSSSTNGVQCSGTENNLTECTIIAHSDCAFAISVLCYTSDLNANKKCEGGSPITTTLDPSTIATTSTTSTSTTNPTTSGNIPPTTSETGMNTLGSSSSDSSSSPNSIFEPPVIYYIIGGIIAVLLTGIIIVVLLIVLCCRWTRGKNVFPIRTEDGAAATGNEKADTLEKGRFDEPNNLTTMHHQLQQSGQGPIYEAIQNENSSTHSQGSPNLMPLRNPDQLYAMLDTNELYAQIEPHISPVTASADPPPPPVSDSNYQLLNHVKGSSLKRGVPGIPQPPFQAVNRMALESGQMMMEEERVGHQSLVATASLNSAHSGQINFEEEDGVAGGINGLENDQNFYHILEPPSNHSPGDISDLSTTAVCNNEIRRGSPKSLRDGSSPLVNSRYQRLTASLNSNTSEHSRSPVSNSAHSASSRANSLSGSSPSTNRANGGGLLMTRREGGNKSVNKYTESPVPARKETSNSPQSGKPNSRLSDHSDSIDLQSDHGDRSTMNTLV